MTPRPIPRFALAAAMIAVLLGTIAARLCQVALVDGDRLAVLARRQHEASEQLAPVRGAILDRSGDPLAISVSADSVYVRPRQLAGSAGSEVAETLGLSREQWLRKASSRAPFVWLKRHATPDELAVVRSSSVPGIGTTPERLRLYPRGRLAATVIGFAGIDSQGLEGVELAYDPYLRGAGAEIGVERDALGRKILRDAGEPRRGADVVLTLDSALQYAAERELDRQVLETRARGGLVLLLDPRTGEILALAQNPTFDPNHVRGAAPAEWRNRAVTDVFEPGSTMKSLLAAAALDEQAVRVDERFFCEEGSYGIGGRTIHDHHPHGWLTFPEVFQVSSNIGATKIAERLGARRYARALEAFGFGARTGVDLRGEQPGLLRPVASWKTIDLATASFGHGVAVTPIQLAAAYGALANDGVLMRPYVVRQVVDEGGAVLFENRPTVVRRVVKEKTARKVTQILEGVLTKKGTGSLASLAGLRVAGKTGTAEKVDLERGGYSSGRIASFVGYFPAEDPRAVLLVVLDEPKTAVYGGVVAAPVFRAVAEVAVERLGLKRDLDTLSWAAAGAAAVESDAAALPGSFLGLSLRDALDRARAAGVIVELRGSGYVVRQEPPPGRVFEPGQVLHLELSEAGGPLA